MPSRSLPNSDATRSTALDAAFNKWNATAASLRPFSADQFAALVAQRTPWKLKTGAAGTALSAQLAAVSAAENRGTALGQLVSHFIQGFNLAVARGYYPASSRAFYQLDASSDAVPAITSQADRLTWAGNVTAGETARQTAEGAAYKPMAMPAAAEISTALAAYEPALDVASTAKDTYDIAQEAVQVLRPGVDAVILDLWDTIEFAFRHDDPTSLRRKAREWGVVYMARPGETPDPAPTPTPPPAA
jgi:hypothetical protein